MSIPSGRPIKQIKWVNSRHTGGRSSILIVRISCEKVVKSMDCSQELAHIEGFHGSIRTILGEMSHEPVYNKVSLDEEDEDR
jgi:hypothetical protein